MGGRGSSSGFSDRDSGKWSSSPGDLITTLKAALGSRGKPKSVADAVTGANPNHSYDYNEFSKNCQRCVVAYELRRRGYDVEALPTYEGDTLPRVAYQNKDKGTYEAYWRGAFRHAKTLNVGGTTSDAVIQNITDKMHSFGNGSRAVVQIFYSGGGGHVFNVENQGGRMVWVEAQTGKLKDIKSTMSVVKTSKVNMVRVDNLAISDRAKNFVKNKKRT